MLIRIQQLVWQNQSGIRFNQFGIPDLRVSLNCRKINQIAGGIVHNLPIIEMNSRDWLNTFCPQFHFPNCWLRRPICRMFFCPHDEKVFSNYGSIFCNYFKMLIVARKLKSLFSWCNYCNEYYWWLLEDSINIPSTLSTWTDL